MRKLVLALFLALIAGTAVHSPSYGLDGFDFGDMPPLPPPLVDDSSSTPAPLGPADAGAQSPLVQSPPIESAVTPPAPPPIAPPPVSPPVQATTGSVTPPAPPPLTPLAPLTPPSTTGSPAALPGTTPALATAGAQVATPAGPETPRQGKITGGRVNVRAGPNTQYESIAVLTTGMPITVLAKNGEWYKIVYPADQMATVHKNFVDADITGEIPEAGLPGVVNQDGVDIHAYYWDKSTVVGKLNKGDPVTIKQERGQWYRIAAPPTARAYVFAEYVRVDGAGPVVADSAPPPVNPAVDLTAGKQDATGRLKMSKLDEQVAKLKEERYKALKEQEARQIEEEEVVVTRLGSALDDLEARLRAIDSETSSQMSYPLSTTSIGSAEWAPPDPLYGGFTGWVENIGRLGGAPATFRLSKGGEIRFYLRSDRYSLNDFVGRRVWVNGNVELASGASANILNVEQIRVLTEFEVAESMRAHSITTQADIYGTGDASYGTVSSDPNVPSDPYSSYYDQGQVSAPPSGGVYNPTPVVPTDPSQLPDVVGAGQSVGAPVPMTSSYGEVSTDFYEGPIISEVGP